MDFRRLLIALLLLAEDAMPDVYDNLAAAPPEVCFKVKVVYNNGFRDYILNRQMVSSLLGFPSKYTIDEAIHRIFDLANSYFQCGKLPSTANVRVHLANIVHDGTASANEWTAKTKHYKSMDKHLKEETGIDHVTFLTRDSADDDVVGMSRGANKCRFSWPSMRIRSLTVIEVGVTAYDTAQLLTHELAHSIGIKTDKSGCEGIMGYRIGKIGWSSCNVDDLKDILVNATNQCGTRKSQACSLATRTYKCPPKARGPLNILIQAWDENVRS